MSRGLVAAAALEVSKDGSSAVLANRQPSKGCSFFFLILKPSKGCLG